MYKKNFLAGWFGEENEKSFYKENIHTKSGYSNFLQNLIEEINKINFNQNIDIHFNSQFSFSRNPKYLVLLEHEFIRPQNFFIFARRYRKIFGWDLKLKKFPNFVYLKYPHFWADCEKNLKRDLRYSMICTNKNILIGNKKFSLYTKRQKVINYCEENYNLDFYLYGGGWNDRDIKKGIVERMLQIISKKGLISLNRKNKLKNYKGIAKNKVRILKRSKFNFCFENISEYKGYVSEKIWDSISNGAIPIYWPSWNIPDNYLPKKFYIDASKFKSMQELFQYLESIPEEKIISWSNQLIDFAKNKKDEISIERYSRKIIKYIQQDLAKQNKFYIPWKLKSKVFSIIDQFNLSSISDFFQKYFLRYYYKKSLKFNPLWDFHKNNLLKYKKNGSIIEFGGGKSLGQNLYLSNFVKKQYILDIKNLIDFNLVKSSQLFLKREKGQIFNSQINNINELKKYRIFYKAPADISKTDYKNDSLDACISTDTMEHISLKNLKKILLEIKRILRKDGLVSMVIDYSDHYSHTDKNIHPLNFLKFSEKEWNKKYNHKCHFQNRLRHSDYRKLFNEIGFDISYEKIIDKADSLPSSVSIDNKKNEDDNLALRGYFLAIKK